MEKARHPVLFVVLLFAVILVAPLHRAGAQESTPAAPPAEAAPTTPPATAPVAPPVVERPFVPPTPPAPSQSRIPTPFVEPFATPPSAVYEFHPTFSLTEQYSDNFTVRDTDQKRGVQNFRTTVGAGFTLLINRPTTHGVVIANLRASADSSTDYDEVHFFPVLTASVNHVFSPRLNLTLTDTFTRSDEPSEGDPDGLRRERATFLSNTFGASLAWMLDLFATQTYYRNTVFLGARDSTSHILGLNVTMPMGPLTNIRGGYEFTRRETKRGSGLFNSGESTTGVVSTTTGTGDETTTIGHRVLGSVNRRLGQWTTVGVASSYSWLTTERDRGDDEQTRIWNVSLTSAYGTPAGFSISGSLGYSVIDRDRADKPLGAVTTSTVASYRWGFSVVTLAVNQDIRQTADEGEDFGTVITRSVSGTFSHQFTPFVTGLVRASYSRNEPTGSGNDVNSQASTFFTGGVNLSWQIVRWLRLTLDYTHFQRDRDNDRTLSSGGEQGRSTGREGKSRENRGTATLSATF